jgi:hypothetical protein
MFRTSAAALGAAVALMCGGSAQAAAILGLFNTGTDASNLALAGGNGVEDPHYTILSSTSPGFDGDQAQTYFNGAYAAEDGNSRWISLTGSGTPVNNTTVYRLSFSLSGLDAGTAQITGRWGADNSGLILLNGTSTGITVPGFSSLTNFSINSGFVAGVNTLDFRVVDVGVVTALRVDDLAGTAAVLSPQNPVPEPATWALLIAGFGGAGAMLRRRRTAAA